MACTSHALPYNSGCRWRHQFKMVGVVRVHEQADFHQNNVQYLICSFIQLLSGINNLQFKKYIWYSVFAISQPCFFKIFTHVNNLAMSWHFTKIFVDVFNFGYYQRNVLLIRTISYKDDNMAN